MKKILAMLLAVLLCLSLVACGEKAPVGDNGGDVQHNNGGEQQPALEEILCTGEWYYMNMLTNVGMIFKADGTVSGGTWTLDGTVLDCIWKNGTTTRFEIREVDGTYFMTDEEGITLYHLGQNPDWNVLDPMPVQVRQDHLEVVLVNGEYHLQLKKQYMQAMNARFFERCYVDICYSQGDNQNVQKHLMFDFSSYYIKIENPDEVPLEITDCTGVIYILGNLM